MSHFDVSKDIVPIGEFKTNPGRWLKNAAETRHPIIITKNGKAAGVLLSPLEYDLLTYEKRFMESVRRGLADAESGREYSTEEAMEELERRLKAKGF
jgi:prevent-host-death family protein